MREGKSSKVMEEEIEEGENGKQSQGRYRRKEGRETVRRGAEEHNGRRGEVEKKIGRVIYGRRTEAYEKRGTEGSKES